jgi:hypothetical protein
MFDFILEKERYAISRRRCKRLEFLSQVQTKKKDCDHDSSRSDIGLSNVAHVSTDEVKAAAAHVRRLIQNQRKKNSSMTMLVVFVVAASTNS